MNSFRQIIYWLSLFLISHQLIYAQIGEDSILKLQQVDILSTNQRAVVPVQSLKGNELEKLNSYSVADAIRYFSGLQVKDYGGVGGMKTVDVRGMGSQHVGVFYDGIQLGNAQNGMIDLGKFSLDDMEMISLYNGQKSNIFQSAKDYASASAIYLHTKKPSFENGKKTNLIFRYKLGSIQLVNPSMRLEQRISNNLAMVLSSEYLKTNGIYKFRYERKNRNGSTAYDTVLKRRDGQVEAKRIELGLFGTGNHSNWYAKGYLYNSDRGVPAAIVRGRLDGRGQTWVDKNYFLQGSYEKRIRNFQSRINAKFAYDFTRYTDTVSTVKLQNNYTQREFYISWANIYFLTKKWDVSLSNDYQFNNLDANLQYFSYPKRHTNLIAFASTYHLGKFDFQTSLLGSFVSDKSNLNTASNKKTFWTPTFIVNYKPITNENLNIRAFYKRIFRMPTFNDLYYTEIGSANLKPEYSTQYNIGFIYEKKIDKFLKSFSVETDFYFNEVTDKIVAIPRGNQFRFSMMNIGKTQMKGIDFKLKTSFSLGSFSVNPSANYSYLEALDVTSNTDSYYKNQIPYTPKNSGSFILGTSYKSWNFNYSFIYVGERYNLKNNNNTNYRLNPWFTSDIGITKSLKILTQTTVIAFEVNNVLDQQYEVITDYPMPGRQFRLKLSASL